MLAIEKNFDTNISQIAWRFAFLFISLQSRMVSTVRQDIVGNEALCFDIVSGNLVNFKCKQERR